MVIIFIRYTLIHKYQQRGNKFPWGYKVVVLILLSEDTINEIKFQDCILYFQYIHSTWLHCGATSNTAHYKSAKEGEGCPT